MPAHSENVQNTSLNQPVDFDFIAYYAMLSIAISESVGPVVIVSNEIGLGVIPMGRDVRAFVDALGKLNQDIAQVCDKVTFMAAGLPLSLK